MKIEFDYEEPIKLDTRKTCYYCKHYRDNGFENECMFTRNYCFRTVEDCDDFESISIYNYNELEESK